MNEKLLTRDQFREGVFARDSNRCVICVRDAVQYVRQNYTGSSLTGVPDSTIKKNVLDLANALDGDFYGKGVFRYIGIDLPIPKKAVDAHHILERRLWPDGGYYLENGASLCETHHIEAEQTVLHCDDLREAAGIEKILLPPHLYRDQEYDKWGNPVLPNKQRLRGELFGDPSVQKILNEGGVLGMFTKYVKYPRTYHLPWSPGQTKDDRAHVDDSSFKDKEVVVTLKLDGENTTMYNDFIHARSLTMEPHPSRNRVKAIHAAIAADIPDSWRLCGENMTAVHSIKYEDLEGHFVLFSIWNQENICLSWDETMEWAKLLGLPTVPVLFKGLYDRKKIEEAFDPLKEQHEGYVIRPTGSFQYAHFRNAVGKYVRANHVHNHGHWFRRKMELNGVRE